MTIAERFKVVRNILGVTQSKLSKLLNVNQSFIAQVESGLKQPSKRMLYILQTELGISKTWLETGQGIMFSDYEKGLKHIKEKMNRKEVLTKPEIQFVLDVISRAWGRLFSGEPPKSLLTYDLPVNSLFVQKLIQIFEFIYKNCTIKNKQALGGDKVFVEFVENKNIPRTVRGAKCFIAEKLVWLFTEAEFEMTEKDCEEVCNLLLPWGYYVALSYLNKEREKLSSVYFGNLDFLEISDFNLTFQDIPVNIDEDNLGVYITAKPDNLNNACIVNLKPLQLCFDMSIYDLVEFIFLIKTFSETTENTEHVIGSFALSLNPVSKCSCVLKKFCKEFNVTVNLTEEQLNLLKKIVTHFENKKYEKFIKFAYRLYVEKYGFV